MLTDHRGSNSESPRCTRSRRRATALTLALVAGAALGLVAGCASPDAEGAATGSTGAATVATSPSVKLDKLTCVAPPGPMAVPMAYLVVNDRLAEVAQETELLMWENGDQLRAMVAKGQGAFITVPSNNAAVFYNKGLELKLLDISVWNITYLITSDPKASSFADIQGQSLVVSLQGSVPDVMFQYLATKEGLDPATDFDLRYATDPTQGAQLLIAGEVENAVLSEALATSVLLQTKDKEVPLRRALAFDEAWVAATGGSEGQGSLQTPIAGVVATMTVMDKPDVIAVFEREYAKAVEWMLSDPDAAGRLVETELPQLGLKAAVLTASLKNITWQHTPAAEARAGLESFYTALMGLSPEVIGGKLPDDGFYYVP